jgi:hypothetical protein
MSQVGAHNRETKLLYKPMPPLISPNEGAEVWITLGISVFNNGEWQSWNTKGKLLPS